MNDTEIGTLGLWSSLLSAFGCVVGGWLSDRFGRLRMLALFIALTAVPALVLALTMQAAGHVMPADPASLAGAPRDVELVHTFWMATLVFSVVQGLTYGSSAALYMDITNPAVAATQFTAYMALGNLVTTYTSTWQGFTLSAYGYPMTLAIDAAVGLIAIALLPWLRVRRAEPSGRTSAR